MKGLILSGGKGTRLRPLTYTAAKQLVPIANKPVLFYAIEDLVESGVRDLGIVVGDTHEQIRAAVGDGSRFGAKVAYVEQNAPLGLAHAVKISEPFVRDGGDGRFVLFLGDNFIREGVSAFIHEFGESRANAMILLYRVPNPQAFGVAEIEKGRVVRVVEKPKDPRTDLAIVGIYMFDQHVFEAASSISPSARGELEITDAIQWLVDHDYDVQARVVAGHWIDTGKMSDMLEANRLVLETLESDLQGTVDEHSTVVGRVAIAKGAEIRHSTIRGPAVIGEGTVIEDSYVGPFTAIDHHCEVRRSEIEHSIVMEYSQIVGMPRIEDSLIGRHVEVGRSDARPRGHKLMLGDYSRVGVDPRGE
jgi:glucose-1-phosphate thymidylyltransferase